MKNGKARLSGILAMAAMMNAQGAPGFMEGDAKEWTPLTKDERDRLEVRKAKFRMDKLMKTQGVKAFKFPNGTFYARDFNNAERKSLNAFKNM